MPPLVKLALALVLVSPLLGVAGCDDTLTACTAIGCDDALIIEVAGPDGPPAPGRYTVSVEAAEACSFTVEPGGAAVGASEACRGLFVGSGGRVQVTAARADGEITVGVAREGAGATRLSVRPVYLGQFPNGPDCGEVCQTATVRVEAP